MNGWSNRLLIQKPTAYRTLYLVEMQLWLNTVETLQLICFRYIVLNTWHAAVIFFHIHKCSKWLKIIMVQLFLRTGNVGKSSQHNIENLSLMSCKSDVICMKWILTWSVLKDQVTIYIGIRDVAYYMARSWDIGRK